MSDILRPTLPSLEVTQGGPTTLARLAHEAEDTGDDFLLLQVADEVGRRERVRPGFHHIWHQEYLRLLAERARERRQ